MQVKKIETSLRYVTWGKNNARYSQEKDWYAWGRKFWISYFRSKFKLMVLIKFFFSIDFQVPNSDFFFYKFFIKQILVLAIRTRFLYLCKENFSCELVEFQPFYAMVTRDGLLKLNIPYILWICHRYASKTV